MVLSILGHNLFYVAASRIQKHILYKIRYYCIRESGHSRIQQFCIRGAKPSLKLETGSQSQIIV